MSEPSRLCPFCGGEVHTVTAWPSYEGPGKPIPRCRNPDCYAEAKSFAAWNRRAPGPATKLILDAFARAKGMYAAEGYAIRIVTLSFSEEQARAFLEEWGYVPE